MVTELGVVIDDPSINAAVRDSCDSVATGPFEGTAFNVVRWIGTKYTSGGFFSASALVIHPDFLYFWRGETNKNDRLIRFLDKT